MTSPVNPATEVPPHVLAEPHVALLDDEGNVVQVIVADAAFAAELPRLIADPTVPTPPALTAVRATRNLTREDKQRGVGIGWRRAGNGRLTAPPRPEPQDEARPADEEKPAGGAAAR